MLVLFPLIFATLFKLYRVCYREKDMQYEAKLRALSDISVEDIGAKVAVVPAGTFDRVESATSHENDDEVPEEADAGDSKVSEGSHRRAELRPAADFLDGVPLYES